MIGKYKKKLFSLPSLWLRGSKRAFGFLQQDGLNFGITVALV